MTELTKLGVPVPQSGSTKPGTMPSMWHSGCLGFQHHKHSPTGSKCSSTATAGHLGLPDANLSELNNTRRDGDSFEKEGI